MKCPLKLGIDSTYSHLWDVHTFFSSMLFVMAPLHCFQLTCFHTSQTVFGLGYPNDAAPDNPDPIIASIAFSKTLSNRSKFICVSNFCSSCYVESLKVAPSGIKNNLPEECVPYPCWGGSRICSCLLWVSGCCFSVPAFSIISLNSMHPIFIIFTCIFHWQWEPHNHLLPIQLS